MCKIEAVSGIFKIWNACPGMNKAVPQSIIGEIALGLRPVSP
jgi:hypothetical protein